AQWQGADAPQHTILIPTRPQHRAKSYRKPVNLRFKQARNTEVPQFMNGHDHGDEQNKRNNRNQEVHIAFRVSAAPKVSETTCRVSRSVSSIVCISWLIA